MLRFLLAALLAASALQAIEAQAAAPTPTKPPYLSEIEAAIVEELNLARTRPKEYAAILREYRSYIRGRRLERPGETPVILNEGAAAVDEAIAFLERQKPLPALRPSRGLSSAARDLARDQAGGAVGHTGSDGSDPFSRMERYGKWLKTAGENLAYGAATARDVVIQLIVDDGVAGRGHRVNIFNPQFAVVGVAFGSHKTFRTVCAQDYAGDYKEK